MHIGIDTSCYTTSIAAVEDNEIVFDERIMLDVPKGRRGLRQSEAVFLHTRNLSTLFSGAFLDGVESVSVSSSPRNMEGSYMPVFLSGVSAAKVVCASLKCDYKEFSHQQGHIMAGLYSAGALSWRKAPFLTLHISGGTTELLLISGDDIKIVGKTLDISAGQLVDRVGVHLGMKFPSGRYLQEVAKKRTEAIKLPVSVRGSNINFSGAESKAMQLDAKAENLAGAVFDCIAESLFQAIANAQKLYSIKNVLIVGGVAANVQIREYLTSRIQGVRFASTELSSDNAVGIALMGSGI